MYARNLFQTTARAAIATNLVAEKQTGRLIQTGQSLWEKGEPGDERRSSYRHVAGP